MFKFPHIKQNKVRVDEHELILIYRNYICSVGTCTKILVYVNRHELVLTIRTNSEMLVLVDKQVHWSFPCSQCWMAHGEKPTYMLINMNLDLGPWVMYIFSFNTISIS